MVSGFFLAFLGGAEALESHECAAPENTYLRLAGIHVGSLFGISLDKLDSPVELLGHIGELGLCVAETF